MWVINWGVCEEVDKGRRAEENGNNNTNLTIFPRDTLQMNSHFIQFTDPPECLIAIMHLQYNSYSTYCNR